MFLCRIFKLFIKFQSVHVPCCELSATWLQINYIYTPDGQEISSRIELNPLAMKIRPRGLRYQYHEPKSRTRKFLKTKKSISVRIHYNWKALCGLNGAQLMNSDMETSYSIQSKANGGSQVKEKLKVFYLLFDLHELMMEIIRSQICDSDTFTFSKSYKGKWSKLNFSQNRLVHPQELIMTVFMTIFMIQLLQYPCTYFKGHFTSIFFPG